MKESPLTTKVPYLQPLIFRWLHWLVTCIKKLTRLTQQHDIHRNDREDLDTFFAQIWTPNSERFDFLLHFLLTHGMLSFQNAQLNIVPRVSDEWLSMSQADQTGLVIPIR